MTSAGARTPQERRVDVGGLGNARDLGGLPLIGGGVTPAGVFIRSESPHLVDQRGWDRIRRHGVRTVLDLRRPDEREHLPQPQPEGIAVLHVDAQDADFNRDHWDDGLVGTPLHHLEFLEAAPQPTIRVLSALATAPSGGVLVHCAGGRDRTGLIAAILLAIAGVEPAAIVDDYLESIRNAPAYWRLQGRPDIEPRVAAMMAARGTTSEQAFRGFLAGLDVDALLARLPQDQATALRTWRGALG